VGSSHEALDRAASAAALGTGALRPLDEGDLEQLLASDPDARVRAAALGALARAGSPEVTARGWATAATDDDAAVRRRAAETAPGLRTAIPLAALLTLLHDHDAWVAEAAAFALGERTDADDGAVEALAATARRHTDPLVRESAFAALGALGNTAGLPAVLHGCRDKPAIRRRAVLALAAFEGPDVEAALQHARQDPDWQVRQNAEDLVGLPADE
jgi:HEAT repeat protein